MSAPYYVFTKTRREFGRHCAFVDAPGEARAARRAYPRACSRSYSPGDADAGGRAARRGTGRRVC